jgi:hypothetical protein
MGWMWSLEYGNTEDMRYTQVGRQPTDVYYVSRRRYTGISPYIKLVMEYAKLMETWVSQEMGQVIIANSLQTKRSELVGGFNQNMKVSWDDEIPNIWKVIKFHGSKPPTRE